MPEAKEILRSPAGERILQEAKNNKWTTHTIAKEMQNYVDYLEEKAENIMTNGSGKSEPEWMPSLDSREMLHLSL